MATKCKSQKFKSKARSRKFRLAVLGKPTGVIQPRVQQVGPEFFGVLSVDCAKDRSKWMLCDFYGKILVEGSTDSCAIGEYDEDAAES